MSPWVCVVILNDFTLHRKDRFFYFTPGNLVRFTFLLCVNSESILFLANFGLQMFNNLLHGRPYSSETSAIPIVLLSSTNLIQPLEYRLGLYGSVLRPSAQRLAIVPPAVGLLRAAAFASRKTQSLAPLSPAPWEDLESGLTVLAHIAVSSCFASQKNDPCSSAAF